MKLQSVAVHPAVCREGTQQPGKSLPVSTAHLPSVHTESHPRAQPVLVCLWKSHTKRSEMDRPPRPLWKIKNDIAAEKLLCFYIAVIILSPLWPCDHLFGLLLKPLWCWYHWCHTWEEPELRNFTAVFCSASLSYLIEGFLQNKFQGANFVWSDVKKRHNIIEVTFEENHSAWLTKNPPTAQNTLWENRDTFYCLPKQGVFWSPGSCGFCSHANKAFYALL